MRGRVRSPPPHHRRRYSPDNRRDQEYSLRHGREFSSDNQVKSRYSPPRRLRDRQSRLDHGSSSRYSEMERPRQGASGSGGLRERRDYGRDNRLVELPRYNENLRRDDHLKRINIDANFGCEFPGDSMQGRDYPGCTDDDSHRHLWKMSNPSEGFPQRDSPYPMFQEKREQITSNSSHGDKYFQEYGGSRGSITGNNERNYQDGGFEGIGSSRMMLEKPTYPSKDLTFSAYSSQSGNKRSYQDQGDGGDYLPFKKLIGGHHKDEEIQLHGDLSREKLYGDRHQSFRRGEMPRPYSKDEKTTLYTREKENPRFYSRDEKTESYSMEGKSQIYSREEKPYMSYRERESQYPLKDTLRHELPLTGYKGSAMDPFANSVNDLHRSYKDNVVVGSDGYNRSSGYLTNPLPPENSIPYMNEATNYRKDKLCNNVETHIDIAFPQPRRSDYTEMHPLSDKSYGMLSVDKNDSRHIDSLGVRNTNPTLAGTGSHREYLTKERVWDDRRSPLERLVSSYLDVPNSSNVNVSDVESLGRREVDLSYEREVYHSHKNKSLKEDYGYERDEGYQPRDERKSSILREDYSYGQDAGLHDKREYNYMSKDYNHAFGRVDQVFDGGYSYPFEGVISEDVGKLTQSKDVSKRRRDIRERLSINRNVFKKAHDFRSNKSVLRGSRSRYPRVSNAIARTRKFNALESEGSSVGKARISNPGFRDIKKRLGPARPVRDILVNSTFKKIKNRKVLRKSEDGDGSFQAEADGPSEHNVVKAKSEPPEKSEEFKQLVRNAFFKFVKQLNENVVELKKFTEQGKGGTLKCWVCGSDSEEFHDTESLVKHASSATRVGFRSQHLGFHKALCALMGWKAAELHNDEWVREVLPVAETASLKKDLILWPPLVIVHNSSIEKSNPDGQVTVSLEDLETMIKDMGFGEKTKVCRGKPVNQSIMLVKFSATYSGFQEAERLHKFFAGNKHGRNEFLKKMKSKGTVNSDDTTRASANNMQDVLYGFMGTSRDLNKLDLETKKRCVVRSKKEVQHLGDAPLKAEQV